MILQLQRKHVSDQTQCGRLLVNGEVFCDTIENADKMIPLGFYPLHLTFSSQWNELLPLLDHVIGRSGIRIHPGNTYRDSSGCILVGQADLSPLTPHPSPTHPRLLSSRKTFNALREKLLEAHYAKEPIYLDIVDASPQHLKQNRIYDRATYHK